MKVVSGFNLKTDVQLWALTVSVAYNERKWLEKKRGSSRSTKRMPGDLYVIAVQNGTLCSMSFVSNLLKEHVVAEMCFCDCAGCWEITWLTWNKWCYI